MFSSCFQGVRLRLLEEAGLPRASMTGGLVQEFQHSVLPSVSPSVTLVCTLLTVLVSRLSHSAHDEHMNDAAGGERRRKVPRSVLSEPLVSSVTLSSRSLCHASRLWRPSGGVLAVLRVSCAACWSALSAPSCSAGTSMKRPSSSPSCLSGQPLTHPKTQRLPQPRRLCDSQ